MITSKDRAKLRGMAQKLEPVVLIGKGGITDQVIDSINLVLEKRELIKVKLLQNADIEPRPACDEVCKKLDADGVQCIGSIFVLYKKSTKDGVKHVL